MSDTAQPQTPRSEDDAASPPAAESCGVCRVTGTGTFSAVSAWLLWERARLVPGARSHRAALALMSAGFAAAAVVRWRI
jgi:hypothetical protein